MFDHVGIVARNLHQSRRFYDNCLEPLGIALLEDHADGDGGWLVYGTTRDAPFFVIAAGAPSFWSASHLPGVSPMHLAFEASDRVAVDEFYAAALANGGTDNGTPGERPSTTPYYAAYLLDPDGNNVEAGFRG